MLSDLVRRSKSIRRFDATHEVDVSTLRELVGLARFSPSAMNAQPLKFVLSADAGRNNMIYQCLRWAGGLPDWGGPSPAETVVLDDVEEGGDVGYWRDDAGVHHVPKRRLDELILEV